MGGGQAHVEAVRLLALVLIAQHRAQEAILRFEAVS